MKLRLLTSSIALLLTGCSSITPIGTLGPKKFAVYSVSQNDFWSSSRMLVVLDKNGNIKAYSGGTVSGAGSVGLQAGATLATAGAIVYGAHALQSTHVNVSGVPSKFSHKIGIDADTQNAISNTANRIINR